MAKRKSKYALAGERAATIEDTRNTPGEIAGNDKLPIEELLLAEEAKAAADAIKKGEKETKEEKGSVCPTSVQENRHCRSGSGQG